MRWVICIAVVFCASAGQSHRARGAPPVEFELLTESRFPGPGSQRWLEALRSLGVTGIRIRAGNAGEKPGVTNRGTDRAPRYHIQGILSQANVLRVPGGTFRATDGAKIKAWIEKLQADGVEGLTARTVAFGLTSKQLIQVHEQLSAKVSFSTKGVPASEVSSKFIRSISIPVVANEATSRTLAGQEVVTAEMRGMTIGSALAAVLRPLGLVMAPRRPPGQELFLLIADARQVPENWPVGWPPEKSPGETMPKLFEFLNVEIEDYALSDALDVIQERLAAPFLYDHNSFARHDIDLAQTKVTLPPGRTFYKKVLDRLLGQTEPRLKSELRVDEAGRPLLWITTY